MSQPISILDAEKAQASDAPLEIPPPPPPIVRDWKKAFTLLRVVGEDPTQTEIGIEMVEAMGGFGDHNGVQLLAATAEGRRLLRTRPCLVSAMADREALAAMQEGSLGRAYLEFAEKNGFSADGLIQARDNALGNINGDLDPYRRWFNDRMSVAHDLQHVLTGYGTDVVGEAALLSFMRGQGVPGPALLVLTTLSLLMSKVRVKVFCLRARWRGHRAVSMAVLPYEELLPMRLATLRDLLGLQQIEEAHPGGILRMVDDELSIADAA